MPGGLKPGSLKDPEVAELFSSSDPEKRFTDLREIGHGSFGAVYFAYDLAASQNVAIKKMSFSGKTATDKWTDIVKEVSFLRSLNHRNVVDFKGCFLKDSTAWLVMEYCIGSASDILEVHKKPLHESEIATIIGEVLAGLAYLHGLCRIHRDVKAGNILITDAGAVKLGDFGSASLRDPAGSFVGTPYWMAPEVILAMDEGQYDARADIWSLGITSIELAERKPPLFNMNAMSALYHIAQNGPPELGAQPDGAVADWTPVFRNFVASCLVKEPNARLDTPSALAHPFLSARPPPLKVLLDLIARTKNVVRELDNFQYRKLRKLMILDDTNPGSSSSADVASLDSEETDSVDGDCGSIRSDSLRNPALLNGRLPPPSPTDNHHPHRPTTSTGSTIITVGDEAHNGASDPSKHNGNGRSSQVAPDDGTPIHFHQGASVSGQDEIATLRRSRFNTLRTAKAVKAEMEAYAREGSGGMAEAMVGYKRLRQLHQKELRSAEERCRAEMAALKAKLDAEYDLLLRSFHKEIHKLHASHQQQTDRKRKQNEEMERKLRKSLLAGQEKELKASSCGRRRSTGAGRSA